jgi:FkbM family methyltransferase
MSYAPIAMDAVKQTAFRVGYSNRQFSLSGSALDKSVVGAIEKAQGVWEPHVTGLMARLIKPDDVCLDIGANVGVYTLVMSDLAPQGRVHAFEPSSMNFKFLQKNIADNKLGNAGAHRLALSNKTGPGNFHYLPEFAGCSFAADRTVSADPDRIIQSAWGARWLRVTEAVQFTTLDQWMAQAALDRLDFIKMDVEGSERFVIEGGRATFDKFKPILFTELNTMCLAKYFGLPPASYFDALKAIYPHIYVLQPSGGAIQPLNSFDDLVPSLTPQRWWADLLCMNRPL